MVVPCASEVWLAGMVNSTGVDENLATHMGMWLWIWGENVALKEIDEITYRKQMA